MAMILRALGERVSIEPTGPGGVFTHAQLEAALGEGIMVVLGQFDDAGRRVRSSQASLIMLAEDDPVEGDDLPPLNVAATRLIGREVRGDAIWCSRAEAGVARPRPQAGVPSVLARQPKK